MVGVVPQGFAQPVHGLVQAAIEIDDNIGRPKTLLQLFARHDLAWTLDEGNQYLKGLLLEFDAHTLLAQLTRSEVDLEDTETDGCPGFQMVPLF